MTPHSPLYHQRNKKNPFRLGWLQAATLYSSLSILFFSGVYLGEATWEGTKTGYFVLQLHGIATPLFLISFGALLSRHVRNAWNANRNRISGASVTGLIFFLIITGILLYYIGSETIREQSKEWHYKIGLFLLPVLIWHIILGILSRHKKDKIHLKKHAIRQLPN